MSLKRVILGIEVMGRVVKRDVLPRLAAVLLLASPLALAAEELPLDLTPQLDRSRLAEVPVTLPPLLTQGPVALSADQTQELADVLARCDVSAVPDIKNETAVARWAEDCRQAVEDFRKRHPQADLLDLRQELSLISFDASLMAMDVGAYNAWFTLADRRASGRLESAEAAYRKILTSTANLERLLVSVSD